ncbi:MAG TPA: redoxin domain-containing protein [Pirellulales bacterium]|nr:redoxin domain-containing protein [Pirellulales bacterium]
MSMHASFRRPLARGLSFSAIWLVLLLAATMGCTDTPAPTAGPAPKVEAESAMDLMKRMIEAYHKADSYEDSGQLRVRYRRDGELVEELYDFSVALSGENKLRVHAYDAVLVCDGRNFHATIHEAPGEVLYVPSPDELSLQLVYADRVLGQELNRIVGSVPLALYLDPEPLAQFLTDGVQPEFAAKRTIDGEACQGVRIKRTDGTFVLWIDEKTMALRRVDYPTDGYRALLAPYFHSVTGMTITADLTGARLDGPIDDVAFRFEVPKGAELVRQFDSVRLGARIPKFNLHSLDGRLFTRESLKGKIAVIKFWQKDDVANSLKDLASLQQVYAKYQNQDSIVFLAVCAEAEEVSDDELKSVFAREGLSLPIARVTSQVARRAFALEAVPTTMILGTDGGLQERTIGIYPDQLVALPKKLDLLLKGGDLIAAAPELAAQEPAGQKAPQTMREALFYLGLVWSKDASVPIAARSEPSVLRLKPLWSCAELKTPGNILVVPSSAGSDRIFVLDGFESVAEVGADGKLSATYRLDLPEGNDSVVTFLRTASDSAGNRFFLGSSFREQQLHLFDSGWKRLLSFPEAGSHPGITDAVLADLDGDGELEIGVGYCDIGVHCVSLDGQRRWRNRIAETVLKLAVAAPDGRGRRGLLATCLQGTSPSVQDALLSIDSAGKERRAIVFDDRFARLIFTADLDGDEQPEWCVIAHKKLELGKIGAEVALGVSPGGEELWSYPLPVGMQHHAGFESVAAGNLLGQETGQWVIAGANGSIHIFAIDGALIDHFNYGASLCGLAVANVAGRGTLLVATDEAVEAWQVED